MLAVFIQVYEPGVSLFGRAIYHFPWVFTIKKVKKKCFSVKLFEKRIQKMTAMYKMITVADFKIQVL